MVRVLTKEYYNWSTGPNLVGYILPETLNNRAVFAGGFIGPSSNIIDYINITVLGNASDFGDLIEARLGLQGCGNVTRSMFGGGGSLNTVDYIILATTGNASDFGDLDNTTSNPAAVNNSTRGIFLGGVAGTIITTIQYFNIATTGDSIAFGDLYSKSSSFSGCASPTRGVVAGGSNT